MGSGENRYRAFARSDIESHVAGEGVVSLDEGLKDRRVTTSPSSHSGSSSRRSSASATESDHHPQMPARVCPAWMTLTLARVFSVCV